MLNYSLYGNHFTGAPSDDPLERPVEGTVDTREDLIGNITGLAGTLLKPNRDRCRHQ